MTIREEARITTHWKRDWSGGFLKGSCSQAPTHCRKCSTTLTTAEMAMGLSRIREIAARNAGLHLSIPANVGFSRSSIYCRWAMAIGSLARLTLLLKPFLVAG